MSLAHPAYPIFVLLGFWAAARIRRAEVARLGHQQLPGYPWVLAGALLGAVIGAKVGMLLFADWSSFSAMLRAMGNVDFTGKTVVGGIGGGYVGVEIAKKIVGIRQRTGDGFAVAMLVGMAFGRLGCFFNGCCWGIPWDGALALPLDGILRHPTPLYEGFFDLLFAAGLWRIRLAPRPEGHLFRRALVGYGLVRFSLEPIRDDFTSFRWGMSGVQLVCLLVVLCFGTTLWWRERRWMNPATSPS